MLNIFGARKATVALFLGGLAAAIVACSGTETVVLDAGTPEPLTSFYIEARIEVTPGDVQGADSVFPPDGPIVNEMRWWFEAPDRFRRESVTLGPPYLAGSSLAVSEGGNWISYDANPNRYQSTPAPGFPAGTVPAPPSGLLIGPLPGGGFNAWIEAIRQASPRFDARLSHTDELLGRAVDVYEVSDAGFTSNPENTVVAGSISRIWVDHSSGLALRYESPSGIEGQRVTAEVTELVLNSDVDDGIFVFEPPAGAIEVESTDGSTVSGVTMGGNGSNVNTGLLEIGFVPVNQSGPPTEVMGSSSQSMGLTSSSENNWAWRDGKALRIRQQVRVSGLPEFYKTVERLDSSAATHGGPYFVLRSDDGEMITMAWQNGDVTVVMDSLAMDLHELINVANSMVRPDTEALPEG